MSGVHQNLYIEWRGDTCRIRWWSGEYYADGRKRYESRGGFTDEDEALAYGQDQLYEIRHGLHVSNRAGAILMTDWLDEWLAALDHAHLTEKTYRSRIEAHIRPYFAQKTVAEIDVLAYRSFAKHVRGSVSKGTAQNVIMVLRMVLDDAVPRLLKVSPAERKQRRGRYAPKRRERKADMREEDVEQLARNAEVLLGFPGYVFIWTMAMTGMRPAELYGLTREYCYPNWPACDPRADPDEEDRYTEDMERYGKGEDLMPAIRVERQVQYKDSTLQFFAPKYGSFRPLVIPPFLADLLEKLLASHDSAWVFPGLKGNSLGSAAFDTYYWRPIADGAPERKDRWARRPRPAIRAVARYKGKRLYLVRHGHKQWLDEDGHPRVAVEARMGHWLPGMDGVYGSVTVAMERAIMAALQGRWERLRRTQRMV
ncbi:integrase [Streptomyces sp. NPDC059009]|uniref:integrase n=1 Tax=Streptomyces sp. NPDC059009 TaxID=3346694 RepID=UPI00369753C7